MLKAAVFDFDGVLMPRGAFWAKIDNVYPGMWDKLDTDFWGANDAKSLITDWKKGKKTAQDIVGYLARKFDADPAVLDRELTNSAKEIVVDAQLLGYVRQLRRQGVKTAILTDHMDTFLEVIVPHNKLDDIFDYIICSSEYGMLKTEDEGAFLLKAGKIMQTDMADMLFVDDWDLVCSLVRQHGGEAFCYKHENAKPQALLAYINQYHPEVELRA